MKMRWAIEILETVKDEPEAANVFAGLRDQLGYLGGRVLPPSPEKPMWRVQVFVENDGQISGWLPDGCHYRMVPDNLLRDVEGESNGS